MYNLKNYGKCKLVKTEKITFLNQKIEMLTFINNDKLVIKIPKTDLKKYLKG